MRPGVLRRLGRCVDIHCTVLGISPGAIIDQIKAAFRVTSRKRHPDTTASFSASDKAEAAERFRAAKTAYEALAARA